MSRENSKRTHLAGITAAGVEDYLRRHPEFFERHLDLLEDLQVPHPCGDAVSLVTRQMGLLREKNRRLQEQLDDILEIARDNDVLYQRLHQLCLALLKAKTVREVLAGLEASLRQHFQAEFVTVRLADAKVGGCAADLCIAPGSGGSRLLAAALKAGKPHCGKPDPDRAALLFGVHAPEVLSYALVPLEYEELRGLLAIGSRKAGRFQPGMGILFLSQLGEILAARLAALLDHHG